MKQEDFRFLADYLKRQSGIALRPDNAQAIENRLMPVARRHGFKDLGTFLAELREGSGFGRAVVSAMATHESYFFRDKASFDYVRDTALPGLMRARTAAKRIRIWCAGASSGQEPYSLAMALDAQGEQLADWTVSILATDIDAEVLERAKTGIYSHFEILRGLPIRMLARHFAREGDEWRLSGAIRKRVQFALFNLLDPFEGLGPFDIVFCRNVLIHFDRDTKRDVLGRLHAALAEDGCLVLGSEETMPAGSKAFASVRQARGVYVKSGRDGRG